MQMFEIFLKSIPKNRSEMVEELEIPDVSLSPYTWEPEETLSLTDSSEGDLTYSTDSSIPLSRAMTDSDIDYGRAKRYKSRSVCDPWEQMRAALDAFPPEYLESLNSFQSLPEDTKQVPDRNERRKFDEELRQRMKQFFKEECQVFAPDDPALEVLQDAVAQVDMKKIIASELLEKNRRL